MERVQILFRLPNLGRLKMPNGKTLFVWLERQRQRRALLRLDDRMLKDIGISRCDAEKEATKPFWSA